MFPQYTISVQTTEKLISNETNGNAANHKSSSSSKMPSNGPKRPSEVEESTNHEFNQNSG
jgi:hypothetical protein